MSTSSNGSALQVRRSSAQSDASSIFGPSLLGTGFEILPPLSIVNQPFHFVKSLCLKSVGFGLVDVPFHGGWELVEWELDLSVAEAIGLEFDQICAEIEEEERVKLGCSELLEICDEIESEEPAVEVPDVVPTVEIKEEDSSVEVFISGEKMRREQAEGTGSETVPEEALAKEDVQVVRTGESVPEVDRSGDEPDLMEVDVCVRTGEVPVLEAIGEGARPELVPEEGEKGSGVFSDLGSGEGDLHFEDFPGDEFERVGDFAAEESTQPSPAPAPKHPVETPLGGEPRKKRVKTLAGRTDLP